MDNRVRIKENLRSANVGMGLWKLKLPDLGDKGKELRSLVTSPELTSDIDGGVNYNIYGEVKRIDIFSAFVKEIAIFGYQPYMVNLRTMRNLCDDDYRSEILYTRQVLCISDFYDSSVDNPFTGYDRSILENVINYRIDAALPVYVCSSCKITDSKWWTPTLLHKLSNNIKEIYVGKNNGRN